MLQIAHDSHDKIISLTCTVVSISLKTSIAGTMKASKGVVASGIFMTVVQLSCTLIKVWITTTKKYIYIASTIISTFTVSAQCYDQEY